ncbi:ABC transporter permease [Sphingobacterium sp. UDSM-2020]|uniref:ABC transporter permease n=1 Tax=Sphingobacterium sp. UDSM-2020 TaxID=2795738 RepID=UPI0019361CC6|nr:ABC transporter permease [Sphingobacterium sp. UDSM-2020]QQD14475.1 ABC transporter permease [Sphingobacterium sp. UDSM-2020]
MVKNFIKATFRNLWKTKSYSFLNIFGLAIGITAAALIFLWVENEVNYNKNFTNINDIYVVKSKQTYDGATFVFESTPGPLSQAIEKEIPGIKHAVRVGSNNSLLFSNGENNLYLNGYHAEPEILDLLSINFLQGNRSEALKEPNNIILSVDGAKLLFGNEPALGKSVRIGNNESYIVSGIVQDFPNNSSLKFNWMIPFKKFETGQEALKEWGNNSIMTLIQLEKNADVNQINAKLLDFVKNKTNGQVTFSKNFLYPMNRWRLYNAFDQNGNEKEGRIKNVKLFSFVAGIVLLIACINFMNLATARSEKRAKEVGMRKVVGATKNSLITQFLGESLIFAFLSALLAILFVYISIGPFNSIINQKLEVNLLSTNHLLFLLTIVLSCGIFAGSYPAFYLSSFNPISTLKGHKQKAGASIFIRKGLVVLQYTASIVLIISTIIIYQQINHAKGRDLGYNRSQVITTNLQGDLSKHIDLIKDQLKATGNIEHLGLSDMSVLNIGSNSSGFEWEGKDPKSSILISMLRTDDGFIPSMDMKMIDGRNFNPHFLGDSTSIIVNETLAKMIKKDGMVAGSTITYGTESFRIAGVVKNFLYNSVYSSPMPLIFIPFSASNGILNIKTKNGVDFPVVIQQIEKIIKKYNPSYPFEYRFLDDSFNNTFQSELFIQKLASVFSILSIIISCLGLFGLSAFATAQRSKEIGIRKVLGASVTRLINMLNREFIILIFLSCLIAFPIAWYMMNQWLGNYGYRIDISWLVFLLSGALALVIAIITISGQALKAALSNPTNSLRDQ